MGIFGAPSANFTPRIEVKKDRDHWRNLFRFLQLPTQEVEELIEKICQGFPYLEENAEGTRFTAMVPIDINGREIRFGVYFNTHGYDGFVNKREDWTYIHAALTATVTDRVFKAMPEHGISSRTVRGGAILVSETTDIESIADAEKFINHCWLKWNFLELLLQHKLDDPKRAKTS